MNILANIDDDTLKKELIAFMDKKIRTSMMRKKMVSVKQIEEVAEEFVGELRVRNSYGIE